VIENLEAGSHELKMRYENGETESVTVQIDSAETLSIKFTNIPLVQPSAPQVATAAGHTSPSPGAPAEVGPKDVLRDGDPLPFAAIRIDGKFEDWNGIPAAFSEAGPPKKRIAPSLAIDKVYLAVDEKNFYMRFDIRDVTPSSLFHPHNFYLEHHCCYSLNLENGSRHLIVQLLYNNSPSDRQWHVMVGRIVGAKWEQVDVSDHYAMKGPSFEASFPLQPIRKNLGGLGLGTQGFYKVNAYTNYADEDWNWAKSGGDNTETKKFTF
jgi:hypothetical protein